MMKKTISLLLAVLMLTSVFGVPVSAEEPTDFEQIDKPMIENTTDSSRLPSGTEADIADVYGQIDTATASEIDSMISEEARAQFEAYADRVLAFEPVADSEAAPVLGNVETFLQDGGTDAYLQSGSLSLGTSIGLYENCDDKVQVLGTDANASAWIYVVDKDAMCIVVKDEQGAGIANALVTISYLDGSGNRVTKSVFTSDGNTPGIAAFDQVPEAFFGLVNIEAEGRRTVTVLDKTMEAGEHYTYMLEKAQENELYIRGVDLSGKDLVNEETDLSLVSSDTDDLTLKVLVTKTGNASFPSSIEIRSSNRDRTILTISDTSAYDSDTRVYSAQKRWVEKSAGLFQNGDEVTIQVGGNTFALEHLTVKDAAFEPGTKNLNMPVTTKSAPGNFADRLGGSGMLNQTFQMLQVPISIGFFPDGSMIMMASYDITQLGPELQTKYSSLFDKSWNPKNMETSQKCFEAFEKSFWQNAEKVKAGKKVLNSTDKVTCLTNKNYNFSMSFSVFLRSNYNAETKDTYGTGGIMFCGSFSGGLTEYFIFAAGPVVIPAYLGFEAGIAVNTSLNVSFEMDKPPVGEENDSKWKYANNGDDDWSGRIEVIVSFSFFGGVGVKGVLGACATGFVNMDIATVLGKGSASIVENPHSFIDVFYGLRIEYYLLFYSGQINLDCAQDAKRIYDSDTDTRNLTAQALDEIEFQDLDLSACAEHAVPVLNEGDTETDMAFRLVEQDDPTLTSSSIENVDVSTYPDSQVQFVSTKNYTAMFRLASDGERTHLIYQYQNKNTGSLSSVFYFVRLPDGDTRSISEFIAVPNKTDWDDPNNCDKVYIGAILADNKLKDQSDRIRSTDVAAIVVDLDGAQTKSFVIASDPQMQGEYLYSAPMPAGREDYCSVAYAATYLTEDNGERIDNLKTLMSVVPSYTSYWLSSCEPGAPETRFFKNLGNNKVYSSGVIAPNEPSFWTVDPYASTDKWLVVKGYGSNGYYAPDLRCNMRVDIDGLIDPDDFYSGSVDFDSIITNWQYLNGCNYFIAGDSVWWMNKKSTGSDPSQYEWVVEKVKGGSGIVSADNRYAMITNNNQSAIYLIGVIEDYDVDVESGTASKGANRVQIHTLVVDRDLETDKLKAQLHGPLTLTFANGEMINSFTAAYNSDASNASGLTIVYTTPDAGMASAKTRMWKQNANRGMLVTDVQIPEYLVTNGQPYIETYVTLKNFGYARENTVAYTVRDENGVVLSQLVNGKEVTEATYAGADLYTGDVRVDKLQIRLNPDWLLNEEHEIVIEVSDAYRYTGDLDDVVNSAVLKADDTSFGATHALIGGKHFVSCTIMNHSFIGEETPVIQAVFDYGSSGKEKTMEFRLPTRERLFRYNTEDADLTEQIYHYDIDMDAIWEAGLDEGLRGISFSLVNADGEQQSNEVIYLTNPFERHSDVQPPVHDCPSKHFVDFNPNEWYHEAVDYAVVNGLMNGVAYDQFDPNGTTTRAMLVTILYRIEQEPGVGDEIPFSDVEPNQWYTNAVIWAEANGIVGGYGNGLFGPMDILTREQFATILLRYAKYKGLDTDKTADLSRYTDASGISDWALDAMQWANAEGLINGRTETTLVPKGNATRAEAAAILMRFLENVANT